jgi:hypothetical protein
MGEKRGNELYENLSLEMLAGFYYHISNNIENGTLSHAMLREINLIEKVAANREISLEYLYKRGSLVK